MVDLSKIEEPRTCFEVSIGEICVKPVTMSSYLKLEEKLGLKWKSKSPDVFIKTLTPLVCFKKGSKELLTEEESCSLLESDYEIIAENFLLNNDPFYKKLEKKERKDENGTTIISFFYDEIEFQKEQNESFTEYLHRLFIEYDYKLRKSFEPAKNAFKNLQIFSPSIQRVIEDNFSMAEKIKPLSYFHPFSTRKDSTQNLSNVSAKQIHIDPIKPIIDPIPTKFDELIKLSDESLSYVIDSNKTQTLIAAELQASSNTNKLISITNVILTVLVLIVTGFSIYLSSISANSTIETELTNTSALLNRLISLENSLILKEDDSKESLERIIEELSKSNNEDSSMNSLINSFIRLNLEQQKEIQDLKKELDSLKNK